MMQEMWNAHHLVLDQQNLHQLHQQSRLVFQELALSHFMPSTKSLLVTLLMLEPKMFSFTTFVLLFLFKLKFTNHKNRLEFISKSRDRWQVVVDEEY
ncbi:hypothetical protein NC651_018260 [Populus alba x Populus x berolinensis]|nr:hypothetical protein NC651_018260 [Populus alba x Populus x berolinensis]